MHKTYLLSEACEKLDNMKPGRLQGWLAEGFITPSIQVASGSGTRNIFSYDDLIVTETLKVMIDTGVPRKFAGELARWLQNNQFYQKAFRSIASKPLAYFEIYVKPDGTMETAITQKETAFVINRKKHKPVIVYSINLNHIINKVELAVNGK